MIESRKRYAVICGFLLAPILDAETPVEVTLLDELDEARAGYCIDTRGGQNQGEILGLHAHSCRSYLGQGDGDQTFDADKVSEGVFEIIELSLCMTAHTPTVGSELTFEPCTGVAAQKFIHGADGSISPAAAPENCLTVADGSSREAGGGNPRHRVRSAALQPCNAGEVNRQRWRLRDSPD